MAEDADESGRQLAEQHGLRFVDLTRSALAPGAASLLPESVARRHHAVPIGRRLGTPVIAVADPGDLFAMDALRASVGREFVAVVARPDQVTRAIRQLYSLGGPADELQPNRLKGAPVVGDEAPTLAVETAPEPSFSAVAVEDQPTDSVDAEARSNGAASPTVEAGPIEGTQPGQAEDAPEATGLRDDAAGPSAGEQDPVAANGKGFAELDLPDISDQTGSDLHGNGNGNGAAEGGPLEEDQVGVDLVTEGPDVAEGRPGSNESIEGNGAAEEIITDARGGSLEESLREVLLPPDDVSPFVLPAQGATAAVNDSPGPIDEDLSVGPGSKSAPRDSPGPLDPSELATIDAAMPPPPPPEYSASTIDDTLPPVPEGYGLVEEPPEVAPGLTGPPLARVLIESGRVSVEDMTTALEAHQQTGESLARYLYNQQLASEDDLVWAMAQEVGLEFVDLDSFPVDSVAANLIPEAVARHHMVLPIAIENGVPIVALANPTDVFAMDDLRTIMGRNFTPVVATRSQIATHLRNVHNAGFDVNDVAEDAAAGTTGVAGFELESLQAVVEDAPIVRYVNLLILQALNERASDIHIEPTPKRLRIRFRIDGVMHDATSASQSIHSAVVSRLKVLGEMDITEHRIPQEGRVSLQVSDRQIDLRLATLPSIFGETCVMRLLDKSASIRTLPELGFFPDTLERYAETYHKPYGVILVTGPTGAGKTTTLYATLKEVTSPEKSVITVEDPVEYQIDNITQVQINRKAGLAFSTALKSILRADPDIVLIGEIRDSDTANIAMEAALSGHLVLSTLHTNIAAATPLRLTEMGIEPFLVTSAVSCVLTQRLARVLCALCKEPYEASEKDFIAAGYKEADLEGIDTSTLYRAVGCRACSHTGYLGREVLAEVMNMTEEIDRMIIEQETIVNIERQATEQGMRTLRLDGLLKAVGGDTTLEEVLRVVV
jgi:type IV pilus assembly protein PilB